MNKIDFIITWVDGNDPEWLSEKKRYSTDPTTDTSACRYRVMDLLRYWFRAVEKYAPWVNRVHFITWGHLPEWLNTECEKLNIVKHSDYIPEKYLPTFSSHPIELHMHRIEGLAEKFVYFNDDFFLNAPTSPDFFFHKSLPCDFLHAQNVNIVYSQNTFGHIQANVACELSNNFSYIKSFIKHPFKFVNKSYPLRNNIKNILKLENKNMFTGFGDSHLPVAYLKTQIEECWDLYSEVLDYTSSNKFRSPYDVSHYLFRYCRLAKGEFSPVSLKSRGKYFDLTMDIDEVTCAISDEKYKQICINDTSNEYDFDLVQSKLIEAFEKKLPQKSSYEL